MTSKKINPIDRNLLASCKDLCRQAGKMEEQIISRLNYIMETIYETFQTKLKYWYFSGARQGSVGDFFEAYDGPMIGSFELSPFIDNCAIINKDGEEWWLEDGIPTRWLFEDFEEELAKGKIIYLEKIARDKTQKKEKSLQKEKQRQQVLKKLTPAERKLLGLKTKGE